MRFALTARTIARQRSQGLETLNELTVTNVRKVTRFRKNGVEDLEDAIKKIKLDNEKNPTSEYVTTSKWEGAAAIEIGT
jgi:large subunit ribosomal protein L17